MPCCRGTAVDAAVRSVKWQEQQVGAERHVAGIGRQRRQQRELGEEVKARRQVVLAGPDRVEPETLGRLYLLDDLTKPLRRIVALGTLRVQVDPHLHGHGVNLRAVRSVLASAHPRR